MTPALAFWLTLVTAYLIGSVPTGYLVARQLRGVDVRTQGSGNVGATNVARVVGKGPGICVLLADTLKGIVAVTVLPQLLAASSGLPVPPDAWRLWAGLLVVVGHDWSCWLQFQGGKGIATSLGVLMGLSPLVAMISLAVWALSFAISRIVSLSSLVSAIVAPLTLIILGYPAPWWIACFAISGIAILRHKSNIERLLQHTEQKFRAS